MRSKSCLSHPAFHIQYSDYGCGHLRFTLLAASRPSPPSRAERAATACLLGVFAGGLRGEVRVVARGLLRRAFVHLEAGGALPFALQLILDVEGEPAQPLGLDLDLVAVH